MPSGVLIKTNPQMNVLIGGSQSSSRPELFAKKALIPVVFFVSVEGGDALHVVVG